MGTNYYAVRNKASLEEPIHIGKSSFGWLFLFHEQNNTWRDIPVEWHNYEQVNKWLYKNTVESKKYVILDEYGKKISYKKFIDLVETKQTDKRCLSNPDNFKYNKNIGGYRFDDRDFCQEEI